MTYTLVIIVMSLNGTVPAITTIPGFTDQEACVNGGKTLSNAVASQGVSDYGKVITSCVEVK
jgi:hypothetical protein